MLTTRQTAERLGISTAAVRKAIIEGRLTPTSVGQGGNQGSTHYIEETEADRFGSLRNTRKQPRNQGEVPPTIVEEDQKWVNLESLPEGYGIPFGDSTDKYVPVIDHPVEQYLRMSTAKAKMNSMSNWMTCLDMKDDWYQEAWTAGIEAYRMGLEPQDTYRLVGKRLAQFQRNSGIRTVKRKGIVQRVRDEFLPDSQ
jgi:hypothetical protein